jgi:hypothetical protein
MLLTPEESIQIQVGTFVLIVYLWAWILYTYVISSRNRIYEIFSDISHISDFFFFVGGGGVR